MSPIAENSRRKTLFRIICVTPFVWFLAGLAFDLLLLSIRFRPVYISDDLTFPFSAATFSYNVDARIEEIRFRYQPRDNARCFLLSFKSSQDDDNYLLIRISDIAALPSTMMIASQQKFGTGKPLHVPTKQGWYDGKISFHNGYVRTVVNGGPPQDIAFTPADEQMILSFYPAFPLVTISNPLKSIKQLSIITSSNTDQGAAQQLFSSTFAIVSRLLLCLVLLAATIGVFRLTSGRRYYYLYWLALAILFTFFLLVAITLVHHPPSDMEHRMRAPTELPQWPQDFLQEKVFQKERFTAAPAFRVDQRQIRLEPATDKVLVLGGSITYGVPYPPFMKNDYPSRMEAMLHESGLTNLQVINLGKEAASLNHFLVYLDPLLSAVNPKAVVLSSVTNEYLSGRGMRHIFLGYMGNHEWVAPPYNDEIESYRRRLEEFVRICKHHGVPVVLVEEPMDRYFFGYNPVNRFQQTLQEIAQRENLPIVMLQEDYDRDPGRVLFYEFIHQTFIGYQMMADRIFDALLPNLQSNQAKPIAE